MICECHINFPAHKQPPPARLGLTALPGNTQAALAWNPVAGAAGYTLSRALSPSGPFQPVAVNVPGVAWVDPGLTNGTTYYYVVSAANGFGTGPASNIASVTPDGSLPAPVNAAAFVSQSVPSAMTAGQGYPVTVTMRNTGTPVWTDAGGYRLGSQSPQDNAAWGLSRVSLPGTPGPGPVQPGQSATFSFTVAAPTTPGQYDFQWRMVQDGAAGGPQWFGDYTPDVAVSVAPLIQITGVSDGDALAGDVMMTVAINDPTPDHSMTPDPLSLQIDGAEVSLGHLDPPSATSSAETVTFDVHTPDYANGTHTITVTDNSTTSDTRTVSFANVIQNLSTSCMFDGGPFLVSATMDTPQPWQVLIEDTSGNTLKTIQGSGSAIDVSWDGTDDQGNPVPDGYYQAMLSAGGPADDAATGTALTPHVGYYGGVKIKRCFPKAHRGDVLVILNEDVLITTNDSTGLDNMTAYSAYIESKLLPHVGTDFASPPTIIDFSQKYTDPGEMKLIVQQIKSILENSALSFVYVQTHGEDYFHFPGFPVERSVPFFEIGTTWFYSIKPTGNKVENTAVYPYIVQDHVNSGYKNEDYPAPFVWMDTCCSAGSDGKGDPPTGFFSTSPTSITPDNSWAEAFSVDDLNGGFLGWMGVAPAYGQSKGRVMAPFGIGLGLQFDGPAYDRFRIAIWEGMFAKRMYMNVPFDSAFQAARLAGVNTNLDYAGPYDRSYYFGNPFLNFPGP